MMRSVWLDRRAWFWIGVGGALGAVTRAMLILLWDESLNAVVVQATLLANLIGCFILGFWAQYAQSLTQRWPSIQAFIPAYCGGLTTFSGLTADVFTELLTGHGLQAAIWMILSGLLSVSALALGWWISRVAQHQGEQP